LDGLVIVEECWKREAENDSDNGQNHAQLREAETRSSQGSAHGKNLSKKGAMPDPLLEAI